ncbi:MFS transporter [Hahella sp. KA22]|uniref:MFS transporter n=1 Tax=Hahella sp. KA22 TaxID=1628392 RepID=UPI000FDE6294|nr:MFS transporter [Hahella sp. KA22]AZZ94589.1 MFS transporter [Hahella sp. KA22]QAY57962.1 MFS transporter [Hahella sp. KA22]
MQKTQRFMPQERRAVSALASLYAMRMLGLFMVLPVFMVLGRELEGATPALLGLAIGVYGLSQAVMQVPFGALSDRFGRKKLILIGLGLFCLGSVVAALSDHIYGVICGRLLQGAGAIASVLMALLSDLTQEENRTKAMATVGMTIGLSFALALVLGPFISGFAGLSGLFWATACMALSGMVLLYKVPTPLQQRRNLETIVLRSALRDVFQHKELMRLNWGIFSLHMILTAMFVAMPVTLADKFNMAADRHGWFYLAVMGGAFVFMIPLIIIGEKKRLLRQVFTGAVWLMAAALMIVMKGVNDFIGFTLAVFGFFLAFNFLEATLPSLVSKVAPAGMRGTAMGVYSSSQFFGAFLGGVLGGLAYQKFGLMGVYGLCTVMAVVWGGVSLFMPDPPYTASYVLPLQPFNVDAADKIAQELTQIHGVEDVTLVIEEHLAYLKIDRQRFDEKALVNYPLTAQVEG